MDAESGLIYLRARYYDPSTAQFLSRDPLVAMTRSTYGYTGGVPLNGTDPTGLFDIPGTNLCVAIADPSCDNSGSRRWAGNVLAGAGNALTFGQGVDLAAKAMGYGDNFTACHVDTSSGAYHGGQIGGAAFGLAFLAADLLGGDAEQGAARVTFGHGGRHLVATGLSQAGVEGAIEAQIQASIAGASSSGAFWGRLIVDGTQIEDRAYTLADGTINVGTNYVP